MAINLVPEANYILVAVRRRNIIFVITSILGVVLLAVWGLLLWLTVRFEAKDNQAQTQLQTIERSIATQQDVVDRVIRFDERLKAFATLLAHHRRWDVVFQELERLLPASVVLQTLKADVEEGQIDLSGRTANIDEVAQTLASLEDKDRRDTMFLVARFDTIERQDIPSDQDLTTSNYQFNLALLFDPEILKQK